MYTYFDFRNAKESQQHLRITDSPINYLFHSYKQTLSPPPTKDFGLNLKLNCLGTAVVANTLHNHSCSAFLDVVAVAYDFVIGIGQFNLAVGLADVSLRNTIGTADFSGVIAHAFGCYGNGCTGGQNMGGLNDGTGCTDCTVCQHCICSVGVYQFLLIIDSGSELLAVYICNNRLGSVFSGLALVSMPRIF